MDVSTYVLQKERRDETIQFMMLASVAATEKESQINNVKYRELALINRLDLLKTEQKTQKDNVEKKREMLKALEVQKDIPYPFEKGCVFKCKTLKQLKEKRTKAKEKTDNHLKVEVANDLSKKEQE